MRSSILRRALPAAVCAGALFVSAGAAGAAGPSATVKPSTGLKNGKVVTVKWKGFNSPKNALIAVIECNSAVATDMESACDTSDVVLMAGAASGTAHLTLRTGAIGTDGGTCGTNSDDASNCLVTVTGLTAKDKPVKNQNATVPITFKVKG